MSLDITKPVRTKGGAEVTELRKIGRYLVGLVHHNIRIWNLEGCNSAFPDWGLENAPEPRYVWLNVYKNKDIGQTRCAFDSLEDARETGIKSDKAYILRLDIDSLSVVKETV